MQTVVSAGTADGEQLSTVLAAGLLSSLVHDFMVRTSPKSDILFASAMRLPVARDHLLIPELLHRTLRLNSLTGAYGEIWNEGYTEHGRYWASDSWAGGISYIGRPEFVSYDSKWTTLVPLRRESDRRQALVEIDAIVALMLSISSDELCTIYRTQFAVLFGYDRTANAYDVNGRIVPNSVLSAWRRKGDAISLDERTATNVSGNTYTYELPFVTLDREADMRQAYAHFEQVLAERS